MICLQLEDYIISSFFLIKHLSLYPQAQQTCVKIEAQYEFQASMNCAEQVNIHFYAYSLKVAHFRAMEMHTFNKILINY